MKFLATIDIAVFDHERQQAFGNTISLIGMGKKVYLNPISTLNGVMKEYQLKMYELDFFSLDLIDDDIGKSNITNVKKSFSKESLVNSLKTWLE